MQAPAYYFGPRRGQRTATVWLASARRVSTRPSIRSLNPFSATLTRVRVMARVTFAKA